MAPNLNKGSSAPPRGGCNSAFSERITFRNWTRLQKRLVALFCGLALVAVAVNIKFLIDSGAGVHTSSNPGEAYTLADQTGQANLLETVRRDNRDRLLILLGISSVCFASIIYVFVKRIVVPLNYVARAAKQIQDGNLQITVMSNPADASGDLAPVLNDLSANFQEVLLLTGTVAGNSCEAVGKIEKILGEHDGTMSSDQVREQIRLIREDLEMLSSVVQEFSLFQTRFDGRKVVPGGAGSDG